MKGKVNTQELNEEQKNAAFCSGNAVVTAGAGSGKTRVLANRFVWLLTEKGYKANEILTLTFTKKAAVEMKKRIYNLVSQIAENETGIKAQRALSALDDFVHSRIQTLDSYSASIVKQCASRYGISPDFLIDEWRCKNLALEISYPFFLSHRNHPAVEILYLNNHPNTIVTDIFSDILFNYTRIDKPRDFLADVKTQFDILHNEWKNYSAEVKTILDNFERDINEDNDFLPDIVPLMAKYKREKIEIPPERNIREYFDSLLNTPVESVIEKAETQPLQKTMVDLLYFINSICTLSLKWGKRSNNPVKDNIKLLRKIFDGPLMSLSISCMQAGIIISFMSLLTELQANYFERKRAEGVLTFRDVANLSRTILIEQEDIRQSEKEAFKAIMIDEFQDNNELQKDILFLLAEKPEKINKGIPSADDLSPDKLYFVGDEKQSIYFFRGADVSVFRKLKEEIKSAELPLKINYRSSVQLIGAFNAIFGGSNFDPEGKAPLFNFSSVFAPHKSLPLYEAGYAPLEAGCKNDGQLSVCVLNKNDNDEDDDSQLDAYENEAFFVAEKIKKLLTNNVKNNYQPHDIAILMRDSSHQNLYEKHLRSLNIPYTCEKINNLFYGGLINDIVSVLRLVAYPMDEAAYAEMLRSPFAGLSLAATALCMSIFCDKTKEAVPFDDKPLGFMNPLDKKKYNNGLKVFSSICEKSESKNISELVSELWYDEGYRYETEWHPQTTVYREVFDYLFHLAAKADAENQSLASFTDSMIALRDSGGQLSSDTAIPLERPSAVHLMTIHKSKGLEFPVVFLCCCGKKSRTDRGDLVYYSEETGIVFSPPSPPECREISPKRNNFFWEMSSEEIKRKKTAELRRLLYVGMTRARNELYITGSLDISNNDEYDDFSLLLKNYINTKSEKTEKYIEGDSILNNDTLFGILLPSIVSHIPAEGLKKSPAFFNLEEIPRFSEEYIRKQLRKNLKLSNDQKGLNEFIKKVEPFYTQCETIKTPVLSDNHITPTSFHKREKESAEEVSSSSAGTLNNNFRINRDFSGEKSDDIFNRVDSILARFSRSENESSERFNSGSFGTIAHICVASYFNKKEPIIPSNISCLLNPAEMTALLEAGKELAERFVASPLGKITEKAKLRESEFPFRTLMKNKKGKEIFINGTIDLFFDDTNSIHIIDFKTDNREEPSDYIAQMACYYHAILSLFAVPAKKDCRVWLYYLRTGHAVEVTERIKQFDLEQKAFDN